MNKNDLQDDLDKIFKAKQYYKERYPNLWLTIILIVVFILFFAYNIFTVSKIEPASHSTKIIHVSGQIEKLKFYPQVENETLTMLPISPTSIIPFYYTEIIPAKYSIVVQGKEYYIDQQLWNNLRDKDNIEFDVYENDNQGFNLKLIR